MLDWKFKLFNIVGYYLAWVALVSYASTAQYWIGMLCSALFVGLHFFLSSAKRQDLILMGRVVCIGLCVDGLLLYTGLFSFVDSAPVLILPSWLISVWLIFSLTLNYSLSWLQKSKFLAAFLGSVFAPLSYYTGSKLGAVTFSNPSLTLIILAVIWSVLLPCLSYMASKNSLNL